MFLMLTSANITDNVQLAPIGDIAKIAPTMNQARNQLRKYSDMEYLIQQVQNGEVLMMKKIIFDNYLHAQVDLMKAYVTNNKQCPFSYKGYLTNNDINTNKMTIKQQWAVQIIMSRLNLCSIYIAGSYTSLSVLYPKTVQSYDPNFKQMSEFNKNVQITFKYFNEGYQPLKRISTVLDSIEQLLTPASSSIIQMQKEIFEMFRALMQCNLGYLKLEKYRILGQYRNCKDGAFAIYMRAQDILIKINKYKSKGIQQDIIAYLEVAKIFFKVYAGYFMLLDNEKVKQNEDMGFVKKQFQLMIRDNLVIIQELERLQKQMNTYPNRQSNFVDFADAIINRIMMDVAKFKYKYSINVHENKEKMPTLDEAMTRRFVLKDWWGSLEYF